MRGDLKTFAAVLAEWEGRDCRLVTIQFRIEDGNDALDVAEDIALLEGAELIYLSKG